MNGQNDQNQLNKQFNSNFECCGPKGSNRQCSQEIQNHEKLRIQSTLISRVKKKISPKKRRECDQEITVAEIEKAIKSFENNKSPVMVTYLRNFIKLLLKYSGISIRRTHHKADISIRRTVNLGTERFPGQTLIRKSL